MVKGVAKYAVIVRPQEGREFEQAIFILSDGSENAVRTPDEMLSLAGELAAKYCVPVAPVRRKKQYFWRSCLFFACGSGLMALIWWLVASGGV
ncbi:MAG: hypothetical protein VB086_05160 [Clostridiaceae bacterium]|nr:hypothetical protein [Clostridiaceae bacterium]